MRHFPLARLLMPRCTITEAEDREGITRCMIGSLRPEEWARERLNKDRIGNEQSHDKASCPPPFPVAAPRSRHENLQLPLSALIITEKQTQTPIGRLRSG